MCMTQESLFRCFITGMNIVHSMKNLETRWKILSIKIITSFLQDKNLSLKSGNNNINIISVEFFYTNIWLLYNCANVSFSHNLPKFIALFFYLLNYYFICILSFVQILFKYSQFHCMIIFFLECTPFFWVPIIFLEVELLTLLFVDFV
jgi:hypothetical protein